MKNKFVCLSLLLPSLFLVSGCSNTNNTSQNSSTFQNSATPSSSSSISAKNTSLKININHPSIKDYEKTFFVGINYQLEITTDPMQSLNYKDLTVSIGNMKEYRLIPTHSYKDDFTYRHYYFYFSLFDVGEFSINVSYQDLEIKEEYTAIQNDFQAKLIQSVDTHWKAESDAYIFDSYDSYRNAMIEFNTNYIRPADNYFDNYNILVVHFWRVYDMISMNYIDSFVLNDTVWTEIKIEVPQSCEEMLGDITGDSVFFIQIPKDSPKKADRNFYTEYKAGL